MFVIERPADEFYNVGHWSHIDGYPYPVIEVEPFLRDPDYVGQAKEHRLSLRVIAPDFIASKWSTLNPRFFRVIDGPVRNLTRAEYVALFPDPGVGWVAELMAHIQATIDLIDATEDKAVRDE